MPITIKTPEQIEGMRIAGYLASQVLDYLTPFIKEGKTTNQLDKLAYDFITDELQSVPAPLHYNPTGDNPYPKSICTSVNQTVCHGIPNDKPLRKGDIVNIDVTIIKNGWHGDTSRMFQIGETSIAAKRLCAVTYEAMWLGIAQVAPHQPLVNVGRAIQRFVEAQGYSVVRDYCGHGIGLNFHEEPQVLHFASADVKTVLKPGMTLTIEPMVNAGRRETKSLSDGWTVVTKDRSLSAQWEHTILVTDTGFEVLTLSEGYPPLPKFINSTKT